MRAHAALLIAVLILPAGAAAQKDAEVTFYSNGSVLSADAPYANHAVFLGSLFDNDQRIGFLQPKHFVTLRVAPGAHVFSASFSKHPAKNSQLSLTLTEGGRYFVRVQAENRGVVIIETEKGRLDTVDCRTALLEAGNDRPTDPKRIRPEVRDRVVSGLMTLPPCE